MRVVIPPGQSMLAISSYVALTPTEAEELRDALDLVLMTGIAPCDISILWDGFETDVSLTLELAEDFPEP